MKVTFFEKRNGLFIRIQTKKVTNGQLRHLKNGLVPGKNGILITKKRLQSGQLRHLKWTTQSPLMDNYVTSKSENPSIQAIF